ncbi:hypothetical protein ABFS82_08G095400 [Erythranthe guttata]|nr:PREDICTED: uncharacterized protein LOC105973247 [Erythranthe guttata]|eukprot:XP_012853722.1 PREDICTED: uncharacterized protein LOC105973247 [Erythranthe guttata]
MASPAEFPVPKAMVCLACGGKGDTKRLIYCIKCRDSAIHHYCLENFSGDDDNIKWLCWDCAPKDSKAATFRKSERISSKRQKVLETRSYWKERLHQNKKPIQTSNEISGTGKLTTDGHLPTEKIETDLLYGRQRDQDILVEKMSVPENSSLIDEQDDSTRVDEPTLARKSPNPFQQENDMNSCDDTQKIEEVGNKKRNLLLNYDTDSQDEGKVLDLQVSALVAYDHCITSDKLHGHPSLESDDSPSAEPVIDPIWRGWFNVKEESETCFEIAAHLSNKACSRVSDAVTSIPPILDIEVVDKHDAWPTFFKASPPTAASIALYFFPASLRDERVFDGLLDEFIEKDLALKATIDNAELLIFPSCELPIQNWRYNSKYFLWGVFRRKKWSSSPDENATCTEQNSSTECFGFSEPITVAKYKDLVISEFADHMKSPGETNQSPLSISSSQASNAFSSSKHNTPEFLLSASFELSMLDKAMERDDWFLNKKLQLEEQMS